MAVDQRTITAVEPNGPGLACDPGPGGGDPILNSFKLYPNPSLSTSDLTIEFDINLAKNPEQINIVDQYGRTIYMKSTEETQKHLNEKTMRLKTDLSTGLYYIQVVFTDGSTESKTLQIK